MKNIHRLTGWLVFAIAVTVYFFTVERTGSLWDCGEFILGAYKLQVVHPPGAPVFLLIGRMFTWIAELFVDVEQKPEAIAFAVNMMSGICSAFAAAFVAWITILLGKMALVGREGQLDVGQNLALAGGGLVAGLATAFSTSIWFSAVEGEVYAMSTFFTALTLWAVVKWYALPDTPKNDRWLIFAVYAAGLSVGVHLLSILTFPALALFYYFKKNKELSLKGLAMAAGAGVLGIIIVQKLIIVGIPTLWSKMELLMVNSFGLPIHSGLIPTFLIIFAILFFGLRFAEQNKMAALQQVLVGTALVIVSFSTVGVVVIRANAGTPVNMNAPSDAMRLLPYLNREQYGERALLHGPQFTGKVQETPTDDRYGVVGDQYEVVDHKVNVVYKNSDKVFFPRMSDNTMSRPQLYKQWMGLDPDKGLPAGRPNMGDNISFMVRYQLGWMYWRYFMWNFSGRQNGQQGFYDWDVSSGNWISGIKFIDEMRLGNQDELPEKLKNDKSRNVYYMLPFLFGLLGMFWHAKARQKDFIALLAMFVITGIGIIIYSNQPPNEPRERDYVLVGSFFTFCIWIGLAVPALYQMFIENLKTQKTVGAVVAAALVLSAPILMGTQNYDDHNRNGHYASRDYASNFLNSLEKDAIIFTYGDNDTYPLWYAQEVENIRTDVRVVNLSLIAVDWYIDLLRQKTNESAAIKMSIPKEQMRGKLRNQVRYFDINDPNPPREGVNIKANDYPTSAQNFLKFVGEDHPLPLGGGREVETHYKTTNVFIPVDKRTVLANNVVGIEDTANIVGRIPLQISDYYILKDQIAILDILASNLWERPVYFAVTVQQSKIFGIQDYLQLEGLALRVVPIKSRSENRSYGMLGSGRVQPEKLYKNVTENWRWGNFDKLDVHVNTSYGPSIQSMQFAMQRGAIALINAGEPEKAVELADQFFEAFPDMNFEYNALAAYVLDIYGQAGAYDKGKNHMRILARNVADRMDYYDSISEEILAVSYGNEYQQALQCIDRMRAYSIRAGDTDFLSELQDMFGDIVGPMEMPQVPEGAIPPSGIEGGINLNEASPEGN